jgi:hypothetical protein
MPIVTPAQEGQAGVEAWHGYTRALRWGESEGVHMPQRIPYAPVGPRRPSRKADQRERAAFYNRNRWKRLRAAHLAANQYWPSSMRPIGLIVGLTLGSSRSLPSSMPILAENT